MSYIINNSGAFVNIKLTDTGRRKLAEGKLNFTAWGIGDSELNYNRESIVDNYQTDPELSGTSMILRPVDRQPNLSSFVSVDGVTPTNPLTASQINTLKAIVNNKAAERGFFILVNVTKNQCHKNWQVKSLQQQKKKVQHSKRKKILTKWQKLTKLFLISVSN